MRLWQREEDEEGAAGGDRPWGGGVGGSSDSREEWQATVNQWGATGGSKDVATVAGVRRLLLRAGRRLMRRGRRGERRKIAVADGGEEATAGGRGEDSDGRREEAAGALAFGAAAAAGAGDSSREERNRGGRRRKRLRQQAVLMPILIQLIGVCYASLGVSGVATCVRNRPAFATAVLVLANEKVWDVRNLSKSVAVLRGNLGAIRSIRFTSDGQFMAMAEPADFVHIFDVGSGYNKQQELDFFGEISGISFSPDTEALFYVGLLYACASSVYGPSGRGNRVRKDLTRCSPFLETGCL
ncbi:hypothetical protein BHM03_00037315 [Ensete ventricosum]|uniref:DUF2415 domain-containing protein n=1 Tax=Ensete ventricosum TaxID=4639 RepID=A0A445MJL3_ENSVE|nr:hypothetical protein BHM03_00037315 [Ensete ventricosum]